MIRINTYFPLILFTAIWVYVSTKVISEGTQIEVAAVKLLDMRVVELDDGEWAPFVVHERGEELLIRKKNRNPVRVQESIDSLKGEALPLYYNWLSGSYTLEGGISLKSYLMLTLLSIGTLSFMLGSSQKRSF